MFLNSSRINTFLMCRRRFFWNYIFRAFGLRPEAPQEALNIGIAVHEGLARLYQGATAEEAATAAHTEFMSRASAKWGGVELDTYKETAEWVARMVRTYAVRGEPNDDFTILGVEKDFIVPLGECCSECGLKYDFTNYDEASPVMFCPCGADVHYWIGRTDLDVVRHGHVQVLDHKTTKSTPTDDFLAPFARSFQLLGYVYGKGKALAYDIRQFGVNALQKAKTIGLPQSEIKACPDCRNGKKKKMSCLGCNRTGKVEKEIKLQPFRRKWFPVNPSDLDRFIIWALRAVRDIKYEKDMSVNEPECAWPMNSGACKVGPCPYLRGCWDSVDAVKWYEPDEDLLEGLEPRPEDYVNLREIAREEDY